MLSCLFNLYAEHIKRNSGLDVLQAGIKVGGRNINSFRVRIRVRVRDGLGLGIGLGLGLGLGLGEG